jgi:hypothetical protein
MPMYYFHLYNDEVIMDDQGQELPDGEAAHVVAQANAREMACAEVMAGSLNLTHRIDVADESGDVFSTVRFGDIVTVHVS